MVDLKKLQSKFFSDPDWKEVEELFLEYLAPFREVKEIPANLTNDQIATEVRGRQLLIGQIEKFLEQTRFITRKQDKTTFI